MAPERIEAAGRFTNPHTRRPTRNKRLILINLA
jgi:hypothetical protein